MNDVALLMQSQDAIKQIQASMESQQDPDLYHEHLALMAVDAIRAQHPGLLRPSMEGFNDMLGSLGRAISHYWNGQLEAHRELHAYRAGSHPTQQVPSAITPVAVPAARVCNPLTEATVLGLYGAESSLSRGEAVIKEAERLMHAARDMLQGFKVNKLIRETTAENPFSLRISDQALRFASVSSYRRIYGVSVFDQYDMGPLPYSSPRFTDAFRTSDLVKDFRKKFEADAVKMTFDKPEKIYVQAKALVEIHSPEFIRILNNIEQRMLELTNGKSKFEDPDFDFDDGEMDSLAYLTWDSVRHVAVALYSFADNNALAIYNTLSKVEA